MEKSKPKKPWKFPKYENFNPREDEHKDHRPQQSVRANKSVDGGRVIRKELTD